MRFTVHGQNRSMSMSNTENVGQSLTIPKPSLPAMKLGQSFVVMPHGLAVEGQPSLDEWLEVGRLLQRAYNSIHWWLGDWLNYGIEHYDLTYEKAQELLEEQGFEYSYGALRNDKYVSTTFPLSCRHDKLSWGHHLEVAPLPPDEQQYWLGYAKEHQLSTRELRAAIKGAKDLPWLRYTDVWNFSDCDERFGLKDFDGRIPGQIVQNIIYYYTEPSAFIIDPMAGGGTTLDVCTKCEETQRQCLAFDINPPRPDIIQADATKPWITDKKADLIFIDPPYWSQQETAYQLVGQSLTQFLTLMELVVKQATQNLKDNGILALLIAPMAVKTDYKDLPFLLYQLVQGMGFQPKRRIHVPVGSEQVGPAVTKHCKDTRTMVSIVRDLLILVKSS